MASVYEIITDRIISKLEQGCVPWRKPWRGGDAGAPRNLKSGALYRGINTFLLASAGFSSPFWLSFKQARERGGCVKKGEHGYPVIFWRWSEKSEMQGDDTSESSGKATSAPLIRYYTVFNAEQCEGIEGASVPSVPESPFEPIERCESVLRAMPQAPCVSHNNARAYYSPSDDTVSVPK